jgi:hypothetical protein
MQITRTVAGDQTAWAIPLDAFNKPEFAIHNLLLNLLRHSNDDANVGRADATETAASGHDLQDVADAFSDLAEISMLTVLSAVTAQESGQSSLARNAVADLSALRRCLDLVADAITGQDSP